MFVYKYCPKCSKRNHRTNKHCVRCGDQLTSTGRFGKDVFALTLSLIILFSAIGVFAGKSYVNDKINSSKPTVPETKPAEQTETPTQSIGSQSVADSKTKDKNSSQITDELVSGTIDGHYYYKIPKSEWNRLLEKATQDSLRKSKEIERKSLEADLTSWQNSKNNYNNLYTQYINLKQKCISEGYFSSEECNGKYDQTINEMLGKVNEATSKIIEINAKLNSL